MQVLIERVRPLYDEHGYVKSFRNNSNNLSDAERRCFSVPRSFDVADLYHDAVSTSGEAQNGHRDVPLRRRRAELPPSYPAVRAATQALKMSMKRFQSGLAAELNALLQMRLLRAGCSLTGPIRPA